MFQCEARMRKYCKSNRLKAAEQACGAGEDGVGCMDFALFDIL